jgi:hypothetical protein
MLVFLCIYGYASGFKWWSGLIVLSSPVYFFYYRLIFSSSHEVGDAVIAQITPDILSLIGGYSEYRRSEWQELKLLVWLLLCSVTTYVEYRLFS